VGGINWKSEVLFAPRYSWMTNFSGDAAGFCENEDDSENLFGLVNKSGEIIHAPAFYRRGNFSEGLARAGRAPKEFGFINPIGEWVIEPKFRQAQSFSEGLACVTVNDGTRRGKTGFINRTGEMVIEPRFDHEASFYEGFAQVEYEGKHAVINQNGHVIWEKEIEPE
jgi:hypothetical protein